MKKFIEMSLYQEVRLFSSVRQREEVENKAELYSIIKTLQELEKAYIKVIILAPKTSLNQGLPTFSDPNLHIQDLMIF